MTVESSAFEWRLNRLENKAEAHQSEIKAVGDRSITHETKIESLEAGVARMNETLSKLLWSVIGLAFTIAAAAIGLAMTIGSGG